MADAPVVYVIRHHVDGTSDIRRLPDDMLRCEECGSFEFMTLVSQCRGPAPHMRRDHVMVVPEGYTVLPGGEQPPVDEPLPTPHERGPYSIQKGADAARETRGPSFASMAGDE